MLEQEVYETIRALAPLAVLCLVCWGLIGTAMAIARFRLR